MLINIYDNIKDFPSWWDIIKDFIVPFLAVFIGAICAYCFNTRLKQLNLHKNNKIKLIYLHNKMLNVYKNLINYNKWVNEKIIQLNENKIFDIVNNTNVIPFNVIWEYEEFNFLSIHNRLFTIMTQMVQDRLKEFNACKSDYDKYTEEKRINWNDSFETDIKIHNQLNTYLGELRIVSFGLMGIFHILIKGLDTCYKKYYNLDYDFYDLSSNYLQDEFFLGYHDYESNKKEFDTAWIPNRTIMRDFKLFHLKFKNLLNTIYLYLCLDKVFGVLGKKG